MVAAKGDEQRLLPQSVSAEDVSAVLRALAASFEGSDVRHQKWQYVLAFWWHRHAMLQPLQFLCRSLQLFMERGTDISNVR